MKIKALFLLLSIGVVFASCSEEDCSEDALSTVLVGEWSSPLFTDGDVEFKSDGTFVDPGGNLGGLFDENDNLITSTNTYTLNGNTELVTNVAGDGQSSEITWSVSSYDCDVLTIVDPLFELPATLTRK